MATPILATPLLSRGTLLMLCLVGAGLGCSNTGSNSIFSIASANPYDEPNGIGAWFDKKPEAQNGIPTGENTAKRTVMDDKARVDIEDAKRLYQQKDYAAAEAKFNLIAKAKKLPADVMEDAVFYRGECQRLQSNYREAEGALKLYIKSYPYGRYTAQANERLFDIANYWLNPTRERMKRYEDERNGSASGFVMPASFVNFSRDMPFNDVEGHALGLLEEVRLNDIRGKFAEKSLFYIATVKFFNAEYKDADYYYSQIVENYPKSDLAMKAMKQSIICKQIANGGTAYDTRQVEKCRSYLEEFQRSFPGKDHDWIHKQIVSINHQQADRDFNIAEFYHRTGHPGSAYFYYEIVKRTYPNTDYAKKAETRMADLRTRVSSDQLPTPAVGSKDRPWYQGVVDTLGPTRSVLDPHESHAEAAPRPTPPIAPPGLLPNNLDRK